MESLQFFPRKRRLGKGGNLNHLPREVVSDILSRLPVTSLPKVKLTCKLWYSLVVDDPSFPDRHLTHAVRNPGHLYTLVGRPNFYFAEKQLDTTTVAAIRLPRQTENNDLGEDTLYNGGTSGSYASEYASCHGLVCYFSLKGSSIYVFNPMIREHVQLPNRPFPSILRWGFGFAPITKKYKCYCYSTQIPEQKDKEWTYSSAIYTLGDGESWRELSCPPFPISRSVCMEHVCSKGVLYWAIRKLSNNRVCKFKDGYDVVSLDLETETFRKRRFDFPRKTGCFSLTVVGETVAAVLLFSRGCEVLFLIDEDKDIWELKYTIPVRISVKFDYRMELLGLWMNQELFCREQIINTKIRCFEVKCFFFCPGENKFIAFHLPFAKYPCGEQIIPQLFIPHVGSLVSPIKIMNTGKQQFTTLS